MINPLIPATVEKILGPRCQHLQVGDALGVVSSAATEMESSARNMTSITEIASAQSTAVAAASEEASVNVQTVASAAEELSALVRGIFRQAQK